MDISKEQVLEEITEYYLKSGDFNGIPVIVLEKKLDSQWNFLKDIIKDLIHDDKVGAVFSDTDDNTHILRMGIEPKEIQISKLEKIDAHTCLYPRPFHLDKVVDRSIYSSKPYILELALGNPQLSYRSFDLSILEYYRNDPRYYYSNDDINGHISIRDASGVEQMLESDQVLLETFGFCYDENLNRAVAVFLRYLSDLSPEHQQIWKTKELKSSFKLHPDYYRNNVLGDWGERIPIFHAFVLEMWIINRMSTAMGRPPIFRNDYGEYGENKPRKFEFLIRPTLEEFNHFVLLLDKMISDNINKEFFKNQVPYETEITRNDGKIVVQNKGTLQILDEWLRKYFRTSDWEPWDNAIKAFKKVRKLRQEPAHAINEDEFDQRYFKEQRELIIQAYDGIRTLRLFFANFPAVKAANINIPDVLFEGKIWDI
jgi:hypothetical protein